MASSNTLTCNNWGWQSLPQEGDVLASMMVLASWLALIAFNWFSRIEHVTLRNHNNARVTKRFLIKERRWFLLFYLILGNYKFCDNHKTTADIKSLLRAWALFQISYTNFILFRFVTQSWILVFQIFRIKDTTQLMLWNVIRFLFLLHPPTPPWLRADKCKQIQPYPVDKKKKKKTFKSHPCNYYKPTVRLNAQE